MVHHVVKTVLPDVLEHPHQQEDQAVKVNARVAVVDNAPDALVIVLAVEVNARVDAVETVMVAVTRIVRVAVI